MQSYSDGSYDYKQMYTIQDRKGPFPIPVVNPNTIFYELASNPDFSMFRSMVERTNLVGCMNNIQGSYTIFVPINSGIPPEYSQLNSYDVRRIVLQHMLETAIPSAFIRGSRGVQMDTRATGNQILVESNPASGETMINRYSKIIGSKVIGRAIVYMIDRILPTSIDPLTNVSA